MTPDISCPHGMTLTDITKDDRNRIIDIFQDDDIFVYDNVHEDDYQYFITKLDDDTDDVFYDHSTPFHKIFNELGCICVGFEYNNDYAKKGDVNTYYGIWFSKLVPITKPETWITVQKEG